MSDLPPQPPPPPRKTNWWIWVAVGCGGLLVVGGILCGGCMWWGYRITQNLLRVQEEIQATLKNDARVQAEFGEVREVMPLQHQERSQTGNNVPMKFQVVGAKRTGTATAVLSFEGAKFTLVSLSITKADGTELKLK